MKNKCFYLWRKICPKCLNEKVTHPRLKKKKAESFPAQNNCGKYNN